MAFKIEKKIEMPKPLGGGPRGRKYPFPDMKVGDSFLCGENANTVRSSAANYALRNMNGAKFTVRKTDDGYRCWRIA